MAGERPKEVKEGREGRNTGRKEHRKEGRKGFRNEGRMEGRKGLKEVKEGK